MEGSVRQTSATRRESSGSATLTGSPTTDDALRRKLLGCWLGKAVGGTLGQMFEGLEGPLDVDFYSPVPSEMVPNDDLDLQVLYAYVLESLDEPVVDRHILASAWRDHVAFPWNEYGVGMRNLAEGLEPPHTGAFDNWFTCGEGAAIRSELWACLAAGNPDLAEAYCYEDACFDHAGDGIAAAQFLARLQAAAFTESDPGTLIDTALRTIPQTSGIHRAVRDTQRWIAEGSHWWTVRDRIMAAYGRSDFTDVRPNTAFVILGWLAGRDFSERICITNNCGEDTDSSTASLGALLGILDPGSIDQRWLEPIGRELVLNEEITGITAPRTIDDFTDLVLALKDRLGGRPPAPTSDHATVTEHSIPIEIAWTATTHGRWDIRDQTELPPVGAAYPFTNLPFSPASIPGTWMRLPRTDFRDRILVLRYRMNARGRSQVRLMLNSTEHFRAWLDQEYLFGSQGSQYMFPAPHMPPAGQYHDFEIGAGDHDLTVAIKRPPVGRSIAEWVIGLVELPSYLWIENAFRTSVVAGSSSDSNPTMVLP